MRAGFDNLFGKREVVVQRVQVFSWIKEVAAVTQAHLCKGGSCSQYRVNCGSHIADIVQGIKNSENIDTGVTRFLDECIRHLSGIGRVTNRVSAAQQHLKGDVGHTCAQGGQALPRVFTEEPQGHIVGGPTPRFERE